jgi:choline dehydrogenase-like flavoprotein
MSTTERTDIVVIGGGASGAIAAHYHLAAGGGWLLERGPWLSTEEFEHDFMLGTSSTRVFEFVAGRGMSVLGGNCVGGGSVVFFATMPRAPSFVFERKGSIGRRMFPGSISRETLNPWYDRVVEALPVHRQEW